MEENKLWKLFGYGALFAAGVGVVWDHRGGLPLRKPPNAESVFGYTLAASTTPVSGGLLLDHFAGQGDRWPAVLGGGQVMQPRFCKNGSGLDSAYAVFMRLLTRK
jgi:hypothetical protein